MADQALATTLGDQESVLASKIEELLPGVVRRFDGVAVLATTATHPGILSRLQEGGSSSPPRSRTRIGSDATAERLCAWH